MIVIAAKGLSNGTLTRVLTKGVAGDADGIKGHQDGRVQLDELIEYLKHNIDSDHLNIGSNISKPDLQAIIAQSPATSGKKS